MPEIPAELWDDPALIEAFASRHMGRVIRAWRTHSAHGRPLSQERVAGWAAMTQPHLSRIENGPPIKDLDRLIFWAKLLRLPPERLWFALPDHVLPLGRDHARGGARRSTGHDRAALAPPGDGERFGRLTAETVSADGSTSLLGALVVEPTVESLRVAFDQLIAADNLSGPQSLLHLSSKLTRFAVDLVARSGSRVRQDLLFLAAQFGELTGWLNQDAGRLDQAMSWSSTALDLALEAGDPHLIAYVWMRKSNIASDANRPALALALADAPPTAGLPPQVRAVIARQAAHAHALAADYDNSARCLSNAYHDVSSAGLDDDGHGNLAGYCTANYIEMEAAHCWIELGQHAKAVRPLERGLVDWPAGFRRDLGLCLARLAVAQVNTNQPREGHTTAQDAVAIACETRSLRTIAQLQRAAAALAAVGAAELAEQLWSALSHPSLTGPAPSPATKD